MKGTGGWEGDYVSWCLKKRLDHSNHTCGSDFGLTILLKFKNFKLGAEYFSIINFEISLYFLLKNIALEAALPLITQR
jgi:hypothetical protein